ncbi:cell wall hydrolase [Flavonifractor plautii]|nr:cell wall hydrolase [Flavonifractor plautii]
MDSPDFPDTIYGVIFDDRWGGQFTPVRNGTIYQEPTEQSIQAAKLCLEGSTWPRTACTSWRLSADQQPLDYGKQNSRHDDRRPLVLPLNAVETRPDSFPDVFLLLSFVAEGELETSKNVLTRKEKGELKPLQHNGLNGIDKTSS